MSSQTFSLRRYANPSGSGQGKDKYKVGSFFSMRNSRCDLKNFDYSELPPLEDEEGELIDDEACFIDSSAIHGLGTCCLSSMSVVNT